MREGAGAMSKLSLIITALSLLIFISLFALAVYAGLEDWSWLALGLITLAMAALKAVNRARLNPLPTGEDEDKKTTEPARRSDAAISFKDRLIRLVASFIYNVPVFLITASLAYGLGHLIKRATS